MELVLKNHPIPQIHPEFTTINLVSYETGWITGKVNPEGIFSGEGIAENVIRDIQKMLNFRVNYTNLGDRNPATKDYFQNGIGSSLQTGRADIGIEYLYLTIPRLKLASPLHPILMDGLSAMFVQPESSVVRNIYFDPLPSSTWITWFLALFVISGATFWIWLKKTDKLTSFWKTIPKMVAETLFLTIASITQSGQTSDYILDTLSFYAISLSSQILSMSVFLIFSGRLLAIILQPSYPIQSLEDLVHNGYSFYSPPPFQEFFSGQELFTSGVNSLEFQTDRGWNISIYAIITQKHARLDIGLNGAGGTQWYIRLETEPRRDQYCKVMSSFPVQKSSLGFANVFYVSKASRLRSALNSGLLRVRESGLLKRYLNHPTLPRLRCPASVKSSYADNLGMNDVSFAFILLVIIVIGSCVIWGLEVMWSEIRKEKVILGKTFQTRI